MNVDEGQPRVATPPPKRAGITPLALFESLERGHRVLLLDVREPAEIERAERSIPGSVAIPVHELFLRRKELPPAKDTPFVTVSAVEERARAAAATLAILGYTDVRVLEGGIEAWAENRLPLV